MCALMPCYTRCFVTRLMPIVSALWGAGFTIGVCLSLGFLALRLLRLEFCRLEAALFAFLTGSACLSLTVFFLCLVHQARVSVFLSLGITLIVCHAFSAWRLTQTACFACRSTSLAVAVRGGLHGVLRLLLR